MPPRRYPSTKAAVKYVPLLDQQFRARKRPVGSSWRLDETYVKVKGAWKYLYRPLIRRAPR
jgi:transposase-like protein